MRGLFFPFAIIVACIATAWAMPRAFPLSLQLTLTVLGVFLLVLVHKMAWHSSARYHSWYVRWIGRPLIIGVWWKIRGVSECGLCCHLIKTKLNTCPKCGFDHLEYLQAECRCWIRDQIAPFSKRATGFPGQDQCRARNDRAKWVSRNSDKLYRAAKLLQVDHRDLTLAIVRHGSVPGLRSNRSSVPF